MRIINVTILLYLFQEFLILKKSESINENIRKNQFRENFSSQTLSRQKAKIER